MDYNEAYEALEELTSSEKYQDLVENIPGTKQVRPDLQTFGDRAVFYIQIEDSFREEYERKILGEYRDGQEELGPVPFDEEFLEGQLQGRGEIKIDQSLLEPRDINYSEQRHLT